MENQATDSASSHTARVVWNLEHSLLHYLHAAALVQALHKTFSQGHEVGLS